MTERPAETDVQSAALAAKDVSEIRGQVKPLDDPNNPFTGQYSPIDEWAMEHVTAITEPGEIWRPDDEDAAFGVWRITDEGYLVPLLEEARYGCSEHPVDDPNSYLKLGAVWCLGKPSQALIDQHDEAVAEICAAAYPRVPDWLGTLPIEELPKYTVLLPNGMVATTGLIGPQLDAEDPTPDSGGCCGGSSRSEGPWALYTEDGVLERTSVYPYMSSLFINMDTSPVYNDLAKVRADGVLECRTATGDVYYVDYDGTHLGTIRPPEVMNRVLRIRPSVLKRLYNYQQQLLNFSTHLQ
jgi:hypothetical protein